MIPADPTDPVGTFVDPSRLPTDAQLEATRLSLAILCDRTRCLSERRDLEAAVRAAHETQADRRPA